MYERLPLNFIGVTADFGKRKDPISMVSSYHYGVDLGWNKYQGEPVFAIYDSTVLYVGYDNNLGNNIALTYNKNDSTIIYRYFHLKEKPNFKVGAKVSRKTQIGKMGTTGYSTGVHLHFEYWICPKGYKFNYADRSKYAKNPLDYCYLFEDQKVSEGTKSKVLKVVGTSKITARDKTKNQLEVVKDKLRCRKDHNTSSFIYGYIDYGIYNYLEEVKDDGYTWYKIDNDKWIANADNSVIVYKKEQQDNPKEDDTTDNDDLKNYTTFICPSDDYYYIYLKKDEKIYYPK